MIVLDTNVISELMQLKPSPKVMDWFERQSWEEIFTTSVTEAEIFYGIELLPQGKRREALRAAAESMFSVELESRILSFDSYAARAFSKIGAERRAAGRPISQLDAQIAAITRLHDANLATRDVAGFANCGVDVVDPWAAT